MMNDNCILAVILHESPFFLVFFFVKCPDQRVRK